MCKKGVDKPLFTWYNKGTKNKGVVTMYEIAKLHEMLSNAGINHTFMMMDASIFGENAMQIIIFRDGTFQEELDDAIFHKFSLGYEQGLLETFVLGDCDGYETAEQVFEGWMEKFFPKPLDKTPRACYNKDTIKERN